MKIDNSNLMNVSTCSDRRRRPDGAPANGTQALDRPAELPQPGFSTSAARATDNPAAGPSPARMHFATSIPWLSQTMFLQPLMPSPAMRDGRSSMTTSTPPPAPIHAKRSRKGRGRHRQRHLLPGQRFRQRRVHGKQLRRGERRQPGRRDGVGPFRFAGVKRVSEPGPAARCRGPPESGETALRRKILRILFLAIPPIVEVRLPSGFA